MTGDRLELAVLDRERALQRAMRAGDVAAFDRLLHPALRAVGPDGRPVSKGEDLAAHRSGFFRIDRLDEIDAQAMVIGDTAVTFVVLDVQGSIGGADASGRMRYTRTWSYDADGWRVIAAHISLA